MLRSLLLQLEVQLRQPTLEVESKHEENRSAAQVESPVTVADFASQAVVCAPARERVSHQVE